MAGLNLTPNPLVLATQAGIFLASMHFVKTLMVNPYLQIRTKRLQATTGAKGEATAVLESNGAKMAAIEAKLGAALDSAKSTADAVKREATAKKDSIIDLARAAAHQEIIDLEHEVEAWMKDQQLKLPAIVTELSKICLEKTLH